MTTSTSSDIPNITGDILLEAGTNELEVLVFTLGDGAFGVNVAKVREVIRPRETNNVPRQHSSVLGMFNIRGAVVPVIDLAKHLGIHRSGEAPPVQQGRVIITEFNGLRTGFLVDAVDQIYRMSWERVRPVPPTNTRGGQGEPAVSSTTGVIDLDGRLVLMIDFESVADSILMEKRLHVDSVPNDLNVPRSATRIVMVEDSPFMRGLVSEVFRRSGYSRLEVYDNGESAWNAIKADADATGQGSPIAAVVSDIEMPRMDGLHLTKLIKGHPALKSTKVVLFSSLISADNLKKGRQVGADVQVAKPELAEMVRLVDRLIAGVPMESPAIAA